MSAPHIYQCKCWGEKEEDHRCLQIPVEGSESLQAALEGLVVVELANRNLKSHSERWTASSSDNEQKYQEMK